MVHLSAARKTGSTQDKDMDDDRGSFVEIRHTETLSENWYPLRKYTLAYRRRDGQTQKIEREVYFNGPGAAVLPLDPRRGTVLLTRQFRLASQVNGDAPRLIEACAGYVEAGEDPLKTARKEAEQETGYRLRNVRKVFALYMSPGASAEKLHLFVAEYDPEERSGEGGGLRQEGEDIEIIELPLSRAWAMVQSGEIVDAKTVLLLQHLTLAGRLTGASPP
jgi:nudix-type nucleoside diphosphatase (YffH/AdpP family)